MSKTLLVLIQIVGSIVFIIGIGIILGRILKKHDSKKYCHDFSIMCYAVVTEMCIKTSYSLYYSLMGNVCDYLDYCYKYPDVEIDPIIREDYDKGNYRHFTYYIARKHFPLDDYYKDLILNYCKLSDARDREIYERRKGEFCECKIRGDFDGFGWAIWIWAGVFAILKSIFQF